MTRSAKRTASLLADDRRLIFISDRACHSNIFLRDLASSEERQLATNCEKFLKSCVIYHGPYGKTGKRAVYRVEAPKE